MQANAVAAPRRRRNLALIFQEVLTATVRLRANRQAVSDPEAFRNHMRDALRMAAQEARNEAGYAAGDIKLATFAVVGFLDESILNSKNPVFANWPRRPLQEELFGTHMAGEIFFQNLQEMLGRDDSQELADLLEVYQLCLLLGYRGRYSAIGSGDLQAIAHAVAEKIRRIRGPLGTLSPGWEAPAEAAPLVKDVWTRRCLIAAIACLILAVGLFAFFSVSLQSGSSEIQAIAAQKS
jgi:type VI secretion system protein ImpK